MVGAPGGPGVRVNTQSSRMSCVGRGAQRRLIERCDRRDGSPTRPVRLLRWLSPPRYDRTGRTSEPGPAARGAFSTGGPALVPNSAQAGFRPAHTRGQSSSSSWTSRPRHWPRRKAFVATAARLDLREPQPNESPDVSGRGPTLTLTLSLRQGE